MNEEKTTKRIYKVFGIVGLIVAILGVLLSSFNFIGMFAFVPSLLGIIFCLVSIFSLRKYDKSPMFLFQKAGVVIGSIGLALSGYQFYQHGQILVIGGMLSYAAKEQVKETIKEEVKKKVKEKINSSSVDAPAQESEVNSIEATTTEEASTAPEMTTTPEDYFFISVDRLRIRSTPDLNGETLGHLDFGTKVIDLEEQSEHTDQIVLAGKERDEPWRKIKFEIDRHTKPIIGWIYGGGLVSPSDELIEVNENEYLKTINNLLGKEVSDLLGLEMEDNFKVNGIFTYKNSITEGSIKSGRFYLESKGGGIGSAETSYFQETIEYKGTFDNNQLHGMFEMNGGGFESIEITKIKFEHGKCIWFSRNRNEEGDIYVNEESNPQDCSFEYIRKGMKPQ